LISVLSRLIPALDCALGIIARLLVWCLASIWWGLIAVLSSSSAGWWSPLFFTSSDMTVIWGLGCSVCSVCGFVCWRSLCNAVWMQRLPIN
jgi:hypothetical protein